MKRGTMQILIIKQINMTYSKKDKDILSIIYNDFIEEDIDIFKARSYSKLIDSLSKYQNQIEFREVISTKLIKEQTILSTPTHLS